MKHLKIARLLFTLGILGLSLTANAQWQITGNSGTNAWLGTNNSTALDIRTNSVTRMYITPGGWVGINTNQPAGFLHVNGRVAAGVRNFTVRSSAPGANAFSNSEFSALAHLGAGTIGGNGFTALYAKSGSNAQTAAGYFDGKVVVANGNLGVGTNAPEDKMQVGTGMAKVVMGSAYGANFGYGTGYIGFNAARQNAATWSTNNDGANNGAAIISADVGGNVRIINLPSTGATNQVNLPDAAVISNTRLFIGSNGNVGIGESNPYKRLTVNGDVSLANYNISGSGSMGNGFSGLEILGNNQVPTRRGISLDPDPGGTMNFYVNSNQGPAAFNFKDGNGGATIMTINASNGGVVGIGTTLANNPNNYKLAVNGGIGAKSVKVEITSSTWWPDYVFEEQYILQPLEEVEQYISTNKHLPGIPDASTIEKSGLDVAEIMRLQMQKIEELALYVIELKKENAEIKEEIARIKSDNTN